MSGLWRRSGHCCLSAVCEGDQEGDIDVHMDNGMLAFFLNTENNEGVEILFEVSLKRFQQPLHMTHNFSYLYAAHLP